MPHCPPPRGKPSQPVMVPPAPVRTPPSNLHPTPPPSGHECRVSFFWKVVGQGWNQSHTCPCQGLCPHPPKLPAPRDGSLQPTLQGVYKETELRLDPGPFILTDPVLPARVGSPHSALSTLSPQDIFPANSRRRPWRRPWLELRVGSRLLPPGPGQALGTREHPPCVPEAPESSISDRAKPSDIPRRAALSSHELPAPAWPPDASPSRPRPAWQTPTGLLCQGLPGDHIHPP